MPYQDYLLYNRVIPRKIVYLANKYLRGKIDFYEINYLNDFIDRSSLRDIRIEEIAYLNPHIQSEYETSILSSVNTNHLCLASTSNMVAGTYSVVNNISNIQEIKQDKDKLKSIIAYFYQRNK